MDYYSKRPTGQPKDGLTIEQRFLTKVLPEPNSGCWFWVGPILNGRYGSWNVRGRTRYAHRMAYEFFCGPVEEGMDVCHKCDIPCCVNPDHLFLGPRKVNMQDAQKKGRMMHGEGHYAARLTADDVRKIRSLAEAGVMQKEIAKTFHTTQRNVSAIVCRRNWKHV